jgi:hypothetical protein
MKGFTALVITVAAALLWTSGDVWARGGRGGGGGGGFRGGAIGSRGGISGSGSGVLLSNDVGYRAAGGGVYGGAPRARAHRGHYGAIAGRTPSMPRPSGLPSSLTRPSVGFANRTPVARSSFGTLPTPSLRPNTGVRIPSGGVASLPGGARRSAATRPSTGAIPSAGRLPASGVGSTTRNIPTYVNLPTSGGYAGLGRPATRPTSPASSFATGALAGGTAAAFLNDIPIGGMPGLGLSSGPGDITLPSNSGGGLAARGAPRSGGSRPGDGSQPGTDRRPVGRPGQPSDRPGDSARPGDIARPSQGGDRSLRPGDRELAQNLPGRIRNRDQWQAWRFAQRDDIRDFVRENAGDDWYGDEWWLANRLRELYESTFDYWETAAWPETSEWVEYEWSEPVYYNYGSNVYYEDGSVYYGDQPVASAEEYAAQAEAIATNIPDTNPAAEDWMPLGVFAITADGEPTGAEPTFFLQLAISKQGVLSGTLQNTVTRSVQAIEGMVDRETQRAAWTAVGKTRPLMETGIVNLTQDTTPALVHFADGATQQWLLVRMDKPRTEQKATSSTVDER